MEGHGDHWGSFGDTRQVIAEMISMAIGSQGGDVFGHKDNLIKHPESGVLEPVFGLANPGTDLRVLALIVGNSTNKGNDLWSAYPFAKEGTRHRMVVDEIEVWENGIEARLKATFAGGATIGFFDTLYHINRGSYEVGKEYEFVLAALAYSAEVTKPEPVRITDPEAIERYRKILAETGEPLALTDDGAMEIRLEGAAILMPIENWDIDDYQFQGPVSGVSSFKLDHWTIHRVQTMLAIVDDRQFDVLLYIPEQSLKGPLPKPGDDIQGTMWLQGYLAK